MIVSAILIDNPGAQAPGVFSLILYLADNFRRLRDMAFPQRKHISTYHT